MARSKSDGDQIVGFYPGDVFHGVKHEVEITAGDYIFVPLNDPASRFTFDGTTFSAIPGYENHPMTNVSWFGAWGYCGYYGCRLPTELEWEKAARGSADDRPFPWGDEIARNNANFYASRDPFEDMATFRFAHQRRSASTTARPMTAITTLNSASPYGLYDMAGNVWQWIGDVYPGLQLPLHARRLEGYLRYGLAHLGAQQCHPHLLQPGRRIPVCAKSMN